MTARETVTRAKGLHDSLRIHRDAYGIAHIEARDEHDVYRQVVDFADVASASYIIPGGASGDPQSKHFADQLELWRTHQRVPMLHDLEAARSTAVATVPLGPQEG